MEREARRRRGFERSWREVRAFESALKNPTQSASKRKEIKSNYLPVLTTSTEE